MSLRTTLALVLFALLGAGGCASWKNKQTEPPKLPTAKMASDTVVLEIAFVRMSGEAIAQQEALWRQVDEQPLPAETRRRIYENGLRAGVVNSQMPPLLRKLLEEKADPLAITGTASNDITANQRQLQSRAGKRGVILAGGVQEKLALLVQEDGRVAGQELHQAQCLFAVKTFPLGDGRVRIELVPEIEHGDAKQRWVGQEGNFRVESSKEHELLDALKLEMVLSPGDVLVLTCTPDCKGLGKHFFAATSSSEQKLLLIRVAQTQYDDLYAPDKLKQPIATPTGE